MWNDLFQYEDELSPFLSLPLHKSFAQIRHKQSLNSWFCRKRNNFRLKKKHKNLIWHSWCRVQVSICKLFKFMKNCQRGLASRKMSWFAYQVILGSKSLWHLDNVCMWEIFTPCSLGYCLYSKNLWKTICARIIAPNKMHPLAENRKQTGSMESEKPFSLLYIIF